MSPEEDAAMAQEERAFEEDMAAEAAYAAACEEDAKLENEHWQEVKAKRSELEGQVQKVKDIRMLLETSSATIDARYKTWLAENATIINARLKETKALGEEEGKLRQLTLQLYSLTGEKKLAPGVGIRVMKSLTYDADKALHWAVDHQFFNCLQINKKNFEKVAEGLGPEFCEIKEVPTATISKEL